MWARTMLWDIRKFEERSHGLHLQDVREVVAEPRWPRPVASESKLWDIRKFEERSHGLHLHDVREPKAEARGWFGSPVRGVTRFFFKVGSESESQGANCNASEVKEPPSK